MTFTDAAAEVLRLVGKPLHYKEITDIAIEKNLLSHVGKSPEVTMGARLAATLKKDASDNPLVRIKPGVFALREWDERATKTALDPRRGQRRGGRDGAPEDRGPPAAVVSEDGTAVEGTFEAASDDVAEDEGVPTESAAVEADDEVLVSAGSEGDDEADEVVPVRGLVAARSPGSEVHAEVNGAETGTDEEPAVQKVPASPVKSWAAAGSDDEEYENDVAEEQEPPGPDEAMRAEAVAGAAEMFDEEEDDDQPILGSTDDPPAQPGADQGEGRRRRRRRRRGRTNGEVTPSAGGLPSYTATPAFETRREPAREGSRVAEHERREPREPREPREAREPVGESNFRPQVIELTGGDGHALDDLAGREMSDAVAVILSTFDRNAGAVSLRQIAETAQRRGRLAGDPQLVQSQVAAAVRADNSRRIAAGQRPRFRLAGGRVALTDWLLSGDLARLEQEAMAAVERYREAARRAFARKLGELPGHAFVEVCVLVLERLGIGQIRALRRPGAPGGEAHFSAVLRAAADEFKLAIVIRRDGREVGRERVTDLRGSLHHYGPAVAGWIFTAGQTLTGAREEAAVSGAAPIALYDGLAVARLCEENDVAVLRARLPIAIPDVDLLEALRAS